MAIQNSDLYVLQQGDEKYNITYEQLKAAILSGSSTPLIQPDVPSADISNVGQFWWDSDIGQLYIYYQDPSGDKYWVNASTPGVPNAAQVTISPTPPVSPQPGALWWKDDAGILYVYYLDPTGDLYWVDTNPAGGVGDEPNPGMGNLQQVTENGNTTTQDILLGPGATVNNITLSATGSADFSGNVGVGNYNSGGADSGGIQLKSDGGISLNSSAANADNPGAFFNGYYTDDTGVITLNAAIRADGSTQFNGDMVIFDTDTSENVLIATTGFIQCSTGDDSATNAVFRHKYGSAYNSQIFADGSATFGGKVTCNTLDVFRPDGTTQILSATYAGNVAIGQNSTIVMNDQGITIDTDKVVITDDGNVTVAGAFTSTRDNSTNFFFQGILNSDSLFEVQADGQLTLRDSDGTANVNLVGSTGSADFTGTVSTSEMFRVDFNDAQGVVKIEGLLGANNNANGRITINGGGTTTPSTVFDVFDGSSTKIEFKGNGSADFAGTITSGDTTGTTYVQASELGRLTIRNDDHATDSIRIFSDGTNDPANKTIGLNSNGSAYFAAEVIVGGDPFGGANVGSKLDQGSCQATAAAGNNDVWLGYVEGTATATSTITGSGAATFAGPVSSGNVSSTTAFSQLIPGSVQARPEVFSDVTFAGYATSGSDPVFSVNGVGAATFASYIRGGDSSSTYTQIDDVNGLQIVNSDITTANIAQSGAATFLGTVKQGTFNGGQTTTDGSVFIDGGGVMTQFAATTTASSNRAFVVYHGNSETIEFTGDGGASFAAGDLVISDEGTSNGAKVVIYREPSSIALSIRSVSDRNTDAISLLADGSASFSSTVQITIPIATVGGFKVNYSDADYQTYVGIKTNEVDYAFANYDTNATDITFGVTLDGNGFFAGNIEAAGLTDGTTTKTMTEILAGAGAVGQVAAFAQFDGGRNNNNVPTIQFSKNIAAITYISQGRYQFEFTDDLPASTYVILGASGYSGGPPVWEFGPPNLDQTESLVQGTYLQAVGGGDGRTITTCGNAYVAMID